MLLMWLCLSWIFSDSLVQHQTRLEKAVKCRQSECLRIILLCDETINWLYNICYHNQLVCWGMAELLLVKLVTIGFPHFFQHCHFDNECKKKVCSWCEPELWLILFRSLSFKPFLWPLHSSHIVITVTRVITLLITLWSRCDMSDHGVITPITPWSRYAKGVITPVITGVICDHAMITLLFLLGHTWLCDFLMHVHLMYSKLIEPNWTQLNLIKPNHAIWFDWVW